MGRRLTIEDMKKTAAERGGRCLSETYQGSYKNTGIKLLWECSEGHRWEAGPEYVRYGSWCPKCAARKNADKRKLGINKMRRLAKERGGLCLSRKYISNATKLRWQCSQGHIWEATPGNVVAGRWCPFCAAQVKPTIDDMKKIAESRGGRCLSNEYINSFTHLTWECSKGHRWEAKPTNIKSGSWCPVCARSG